MIDITRSRVSHFMKKFRELSLISYNGHIEVYSSLLLEAGPGRNWQSATRSIVQEHFSVWDDALPLITRLEPIRKVVESEESVVIPCEAPDSLVEGCQCGSLNIAALPIAVACVIRAI
jgi:hypothetical protein